MNKKTAGIITTGLLGVTGLAIAMGDKKMRNRANKAGKKMENRTQDIMSKMDIF